MEQIVEIGEHRFMLGLQWLQIQGKDPLLAAKTKAQSGKTPFGIIRSIDRGDGSSSFQAAMTAKKHKGPVHVGGAHLVNIHPSVIAIEKLDTDLYWMCVADSGRILPGYDTVSSDSEIKMLLSELSSEYELEYMIMVMDEAVASIFGVSNYSGTSPIEVIASKAPSEATKIRNLAGVPTSVYLGGLVGIVAIGMGGVWGYQKYQSNVEFQRMVAMEQAAQEERERLARAGKTEVTEADILARARDEEITWLRDEFNKQRLVPTMKQMVMLNDSLPSYFMGWRLSGISFSSDSPDEMVSLWVREKGLAVSLNKLFRNSGETVAFSTDLNTARVGHPVSLGSAGITDIIDHIKTKGLNHQTFADILTSGGYPLGIKIKDVTTRAEPIEGIQDQHIRNMPQLITRQREFATEASSRESFLLLMSRLTGAGNFLPVSLAVEKIGSDTIWTINGTLYEM